MKNIVILGAGTGGALTANLLSHRLDLRQWKITVIDEAPLHVYQPGLLFLPFGMYGYREQDDVVRPIAAPLPRGVAFVAAEVVLIDHAQREVHTDDGNYPYDFLVGAMGCRSAPEEIEGMARAMGHDGVHTFYTLEGALAMREAIAGMREGRLVIDICEMPIKCPVAPLEFAFLADCHFREKGIRDRIEISLVTPYTGAFTKPNANRILSKVADEKGIRVVPNFATSAVDADKRLIRTFDGRTVDFDLLCAIPPNLGPAVIDGSDLGDGAGLRAHRSADAQEPQGRAHLPARRQHERRDLQGGLGRALRGRDRRGEPAARDRRQAAALDVRRPRELLRRDRPPQGDAARLQLRHRAARGHVPAAASRPLLAARGEPPEPPGQARVQVGVLEHAAAGAPAQRADAARAHELPRQGPQHGAADPRGAGRCTCAT